MASLPRNRFLLVPLTWVALAVMGCNPKPCTEDAACEKNQVCNKTSGPLGRCEDAPTPEVVSCGSNSDCKNARVCANGTCRFGADCMNISGVYDVYPASLTSVVAPQKVRLTTPGDCVFVSSVATGAGTPVVTLEGTLDNTGHLTRRAPASCDADVLGDETIKVTCGTGNTTDWHYYASPDPDPMVPAKVHAFYPKRCGTGVTPCNGRQCPEGGCGTPEACPLNSKGIPVCTR